MLYLGPITSDLPAVPLLTNAWPMARPNLAPLGGLFLGTPLRRGPRCPAHPDPGVSARRGPATKNTTAGQPLRSAVRSIAIIVALVLLLWLNRESVRAFIDFARDRQAVVAYIDQLGLVGPLVLMGLAGLQVLIPSLPAEPPMIAGAYIYGFSTGFLMSWLASVAATQAVFYLARRAGRPVAERFIPANLLDKWTRIAGEKGALLFLLASVIPPIPSDIMIYVAGLSEIEGRRSLWRMPWAECR